MQKDSFLTELALATAAYIAKRGEVRPLEVYRGECDIEVRDNGKTVATLWPSMKPLEGWKWTLGPAI